MVVQDLDFKTMLFFIFFIHFWVLKFHTIYLTFSPRQIFFLGFGTEADLSCRFRKLTMSVKHHQNHDDLQQRFVCHNTNSQFVLYHHLLFGILLKNLLALLFGPLFMNIIVYVYVISLTSVMG